MITKRQIRRFAELAEDWNYLAGYQGWGVALPAIWGKCFSTIYQHQQYIVLARALLAPLPKLPPKIDLEIRPFEPADLDLVRGTDLPSEVKLCARRLECGHRGFLALSHRRFVGYGWAYTAACPALDSVRLELMPWEVLFVSDYTLPEFRSRGVQTALILARLREYRRRGYQHAFACVHQQNSPSLAAFLKVGFGNYGLLDVLRLGPWRRANYQPFIVKNT